MPRLVWPKKDAGYRESHRGAVYQALIRWCPNGVTPRLGNQRESSDFIWGRVSRGTEISQCTRRKINRSEIP